MVDDSGNQFDGFFYDYIEQLVSVQYDEFFTFGETNAYFFMVRELWGPLNEDLDEGLAGLVKEEIRRDRLR